MKCLSQSLLGLATGLLCGVLSSWASGVTQSGGAPSTSPAATSPTASAHAAHAVDSDLVAYRVGRLWSGTGAPCDNAVVVVQHGKILAAGPASEVSVPPNARVVDFGRQVMIPGLVIAETAIGQPAPDELAITPQLQVLNGLDLISDQQALLRGGITAIQVTAGSERLLPGQNAVVKTFGDPADRIVSAAESLQINLTQAAFAPPTVYEPPVGANSGIRPLEATRPQLAGSLSEAVAGLQVLRQALETSAGPPTSLLEEEIAESLAQAWREKTLAVRIAARSSSELLAAQRVAEQFQIHPLLCRADYLTHSGLTAEQLATFRGFVLSPNQLPGTVRDVPLPDPQQLRPDYWWEAAAWLKDQGRWGDVTVGGLSENELPRVLILAQWLQRAGVSAEELLAMLTVNSARLMNIDSRCGSISPGKDADLVILSHDPFTRGSQVLQTIVGGQVAFALDKEPTPLPSDREWLIRAQAVYTPQGWVDAGSVVVRGDKIAAVGSQVSAAVSAQTIDYPTAYVVPGWIDLATDLGLGGPLRDRLELNSTLGSQLVSEDPTVQWVRQAGITTALVGSSRSPSPVLAFKLGDQPRVLRDPVAIRVDVTGNLTTAGESLRRSLTQAKAYVDSWLKYDSEMEQYRAALKAYEAEVARLAAEKAKAEAEAKAKAEADAKAAGTGETSGRPPAPGADPDSSRRVSPPTPEKPEEKKTDEKKPEEKKPEAEKPKADVSAEKSEPASPTDKPAGDPAAVAVDEPKKPTEPTKPREVPNLEPYRAVFAGKIPVIVNAADARSIELAIQILADEFKLRTVIAGAEDVGLSLTRLKHPLVSVIVGPGLTVTRSQVRQNLPQQLATAGIPFGFQSRAASGSALLPSAVATATYEGLSPQDALLGFTQFPADFLQLNSVGQLAVGKDADLVVLSGPPFDLGTEVLAVMIDGRWVYHKESHP